MQANPWKALLLSRKFWMAIFALVQSVVFYLLPDFPNEIWLAIDGVIITVILGITIEDAAEKLGSSLNGK